MLHTDKMITLGTDPGMAEFVLLGELIREESRNLGLGTEALSEADGLLWTQLARECARRKEVLLTMIKSWLIFLHHFCTLTDHILPVAGF